MRFRQAAAIPAVAAIALGGAVAFGGCGSDSDKAMQHEDSSSDPMEG